MNNFQTGVKAIIICNKKILLISRTMYNPNEGFQGEGTWEMPGGRIDDGETKEEGLAREIYQETGIPTDVSMIIYHPEDDNFQEIIKKDGSIVHRFTFILQLNATEFPQIRLSEEHKDAKWVTITDLIALQNQLEKFFIEWLQSHKNILEEVIL